MASTEYELQRAAYTPNNIAIEYNLKISVNRTKAMGVMKGKMIVRTKIVIDNSIIEEVNNFNYLRYATAVSRNGGLEIKVNRLNQMCSTIGRTLNNKKREGTQILTYGAELFLRSRQLRSYSRTSQHFKEP
jgi:N12 class adenine-specific DNA methylase